LGTRRHPDQCFPWNFLSGPSPPGATCRPPSPLAFSPRLPYRQFAGPFVPRTRRKKRDTASGFRASPVLVAWGEPSRGPMAEIPPTRASLLVRLRDPQDEEAWTQFVQRYAPVVYGYARKQGLQDADAADLTQDVLRAVVGAVGRLEYDPARGSFRN